MQSDSKASTWQPNVPFARAYALNDDAVVKVDDPVRLGASADQESWDIETEGQARSFSQDGLAQAQIPGRSDLLLDYPGVMGYLASELATPLLESLYPHLWLVARKDSKNVDALHRQIIKDRQIIVSEDPQLHLFWTTRRVYVKPMPVCLSSYVFWEQCLGREQFVDTHRQEPNLYATGSAPRQFDRRTALGFLRSYALLIRHPSDFKIAKEKGLLPEHYDWDAWSSFISHFRDLDDARVSQRYHYGQIRLSRMNWAMRIFRPRKDGGFDANLYYERSYWSASPYVHSAAVVLAFIFAAFSLVLSAMQVTLAAPAANPDVYTTAGLASFARAFFGFSIAVMLASMVALVLLVTLPALHVFYQLFWGFIHRDARGSAHEARR